MVGVAALPMYDFPQIRESTNLFWLQIQRELTAAGVFAPDKLTRPTDFLAFWKRPDLIFSQTCGLPFVKHLSDETRIIGTPDFGLGPRPGRYHSVFVVGKDIKANDLAAMRGARFCFNDPESLSGLYAPMHKLLSKFGTLDFFGEFLHSGGHTNSVFMVANGHADIAAIDAVSWRFIQKYQPLSQQLKILTITETLPALPYICNKSQNAALIAAAVERAIYSLPDRLKQKLGIIGFWRSKFEDYVGVEKLAAQVFGPLKKLGLGEEISPKPIFQQNNLAATLPE